MPKQSLTVIEHVTSVQRGPAADGEHNCYETYFGFTKREVLMIVMTHAVVSSGHPLSTMPEYVAQEAEAYADAMMDKMNKRRGGRHE